MIEFELTDHSDGYRTETTIEFSETGNTDPDQVIPISTPITPDPDVPCLYMKDSGNDFLSTILAGINPDNVTVVPIFFNSRQNSVYSLAAKIHGKISQHYTFILEKKNQKCLYEIDDEFNREIELSASDGNEYEFKLFVFDKRIQFKGLLCPK